ncbi:MAG TPA: exonuclease SbcCD subunit D [Armatimonadota bacterium]|nr:exonuclease SbcCD subunit D [Armatimonadota bacterium]
MKIMHFADAHFGVETYGKVDPETGLNSRLVDFRRSLDLAIDKALEAGVHLALFAGDAYKSRDPNQTQQREFASCIRNLTDAGIPVIMVTGNHDVPNSRARANAVEIYRTLGVSNVHILSKPEVLRLDTSAGPIQIAGMPFLLRSSLLSREDCKDKTITEITDLMIAKYCEYIDYLARQLDSAIPSVLLGHFWIKNARTSSTQSYFNAAEPEVLVSAVANPAFDYVAMGHLHKFQDLNKGSNPPVVYAGSIDRTDFGERNEEKGWVLVELEKGSACPDLSGVSYDFVSVPARRFVEIEVDADVEDPTAKILKAIDPEDVRDAIVKLLYHIPQDKLALVREAEIREALAPAFLVVSITKDVVRDSQAQRNKLLTESMDPIKALDMYFDTRDDTRKRKSDLMSYARPIIEELIAEEQVK